MQKPKVDIKMEYILNGEEDHLAVWPLNTIALTSFLTAWMWGHGISTFLPFHHVSCNNNRDHNYTDTIIQCRRYMTHQLLHPSTYPYIAPPCWGRSSLPLSCTPLAAWDQLQGLVLVKHRLGQTRSQMTAASHYRALHVGKGCRFKITAKGLRILEA